MKAVYAAPVLVATGEVVKLTKSGEVKLGEGGFQETEAVGSVGFGL